MINNCKRIAYKPLKCDITQFEIFQTPLELSNCGNLSSLIVTVMVELGW